MKLNTQTVVDVIYRAIQQDIQCLQDNLDEKTPENAHRKWHDNVWSAEMYSKFSESCACIWSLLGVLNELGITPVYRNETFEKKAREWSAIQ